MILEMFSKLFILGVILTVSYGFSKDVEDSSEKSRNKKGCKIANCDVCNVNKKICLSCSVGWGRNNVGTCSACKANCNHCSLNVNVCTQCSAPTLYKLIAGQCKRYQQGLEVQGQGQEQGVDKLSLMTSRTSTFEILLKNSQAPQECEISNCKICNDDLTKCSICVEKYRVNTDYKCSEICPANFTYMNSSGSCFKYIDIAVSYMDAVLLCNSTDTHLPILLNKETANSLLEFTSIVYHAMIWLALERENSSSPLTWKSYNDNTITPLTNWYLTDFDKGYPFVMMSTYNDWNPGIWENVHDYGPNYVVCQYDPHFM